MMKRWIIIVALAGGLCLWFSGTVAAHGSPHQHSTSPFEVLESGETLHCPLHLLGQICPHGHPKKIDVVDVLQISSECGGYPAGGIPASFGFEKNPNLTQSSAPLQPVMKSYLLISSIQPYATVFSDSPEYPPKFL